MLSIEQIVVGCLLILVLVSLLVVRNRFLAREVSRLERKADGDRKTISSLQHRLDELTSRHQMLVDAVRQEAKGWPANIDAEIPPKPQEPIPPSTPDGASCACPNGSGYGCTGNPSTCIQYEQERYQYMGDMESYNNLIREWQKNYSDEQVALQGLKRAIDACRRT